MPAPTAFSTARILLAASVVAIGLYGALRQGEPPLIDAPDAVARRIDEAAKEEDEPEYDVVIIGGGTAGCVLASRLSEDPRVRLLLLEAGGSSRNVQESQIPATYGALFHTERDYGLWTEPQVNADNLKKYWPRGKMLGGCSASNAMIFHAGAPTDYDEWAQNGQDGAEQWSHEKLLPYFHKFETFIPSSQYPDVDRSMRGSNGPVRVGYFGHLHSTCAKWIESCRNIGIIFNPDVNNPETGTLGVTKPITYIDSSGKRVNTETAYLTPKVLKRRNLKVAIHSHVTRILFDTSEGTKKAVGVEFAKGKGGPRYRVRAKQEIVLAAGAIHSPHILMLSGIGPKEHLAEYNIPLVHDHPGVGQKLQDHLVVNTRFRVKPGHSLQYIIDTRGTNSLWALLDLARWKIFGTGPLTTNLAEAAAFTRSDDLKLINPDSYEVKDESSGPNAPDLETIIIPLGYPIADRPIPPCELMTMGTILLRPQSFGTLSLRSSDPFDAPLIDPRYLSTKNDVAVLVRGLRLALRIVKADPLASVIEHDDDPLLDHNLGRLTDAELEAEVRMRPQTLFHPTTTCRMAKQEDGGVVDSYLRVHAIQNLRIADASIFPHIPAGHTAAPSIAVGEKASDLIKGSLKL